MTNLRKIHAAHNSIHRLNKSGVGFNVRGLSRGRIEEIIKGESAVPTKMPAQHLQVMANRRVVHAEACALASTYPFGLLAGTVHRDESPMLEHSLSLAKYANRNILHHDISPAVEQALFFQSYLLRETDLQHCLCATRQILLYYKALSRSTGNGSFLPIVIGY